MTAPALENPALRRMLKPAKPVTSGSRMAEAKAWRLSLPRVSENTISMVATVVGYEVRTTFLEAILADWEGYALSLLMNGPDGARGLVQLDDALRTGLIEAQTMGRVLNSTLEPRAGTPIDAALCDHVVNAWMKGAAEAGERVSEWTASGIMRDPRAAKVALDDGEYQATEVSVSLGEGARLGVLRILKPAASAGGARGAALAGSGRHAGFLALEAEIEAVLYKAKVPYEWLRTLQPGSLLEIPRRAIDHVEIKTIDGKRITRARLGQVGGKRAVRILEEDAPESDPPSGARPEPGRPARLAGAGRAQFGALPDLPLTEPPGGLPDLPLPEPGVLPDIPGLPPLGGED